MFADTDLKESMRAEASNLGFSLFGIAQPKKPAHHDTFINWVQTGRHASMDYLARPDSLSKRADPGSLMSGCRTIVCVGIRYPRPQDAPLPHTEPSGQVAAYAWGEDYHDVLVPRLKRLADWCAARLDRPVQARPYTDTGPLLERDLAQQAGLGWIGKNTCLIHPQMGSYFLLAELLLDVELPADTPFETDHCGTCTRCIDNCPTEAILPDRTLDAGRCISYLTIENKGSIQPELRSKMGSWVFGCDICQQVCPWNIRFADPEAEPALAPQPGFARPDLHAALQMTPQEFNRRFKTSPIRRAKRRGFLRNAAIALGNIGSPASVPPLEKALRSEAEPLVRAHAAWSLGKIGTSEALEALQSAARKEVDLDVLSEIQSALKHSEKQ